MYSAKKMIKADIKNETIKGIENRENKFDESLLNHINVPHTNLLQLQKLKQKLLKRK